MALYVLGTYYSWNFVYHTHQTFFKQRPVNPVCSTQSPRKTVHKKLDIIQWWTLTSECKFPFDLDPANLFKVMVGWLKNIFPYSATRVFFTWFLRFR